jgi:hypothetical protein
MGEHGGAVTVFVYSLSRWRTHLKGRNALRWQLLAERLLTYLLTLAC